MFSILYHKKPFFNNCNFPSVPCINFLICPMISCIPIPTIYFTSFLTWRFHYNFVSIWYTIRDHLGGTLFALTHFHVVHLTTTTHPTCVFPSFIDDTHIVGPISNVVPTFLQLHAKFTTLRFFTQPMKCVIWFPQGLNIHMTSSKFFLHWTQVFIF